MSDVHSCEIIEALEDKCPCRTVQIRQLTALYSDLYPPLRNLVVHGISGTGKLHTVRSVLEGRKISHAVVRSEECLSLRHLLWTVQCACVEAAYPDRHDQDKETYLGRVESVNALGVNLQRLLGDREGRLVLVLDGIDKQRGLHATTLPALVRLSDVIPGLCLILVVTSPRALSLQKAGIPYLHFPPYNRAESISLVTGATRLLAPREHLDQRDDAATLEKWYSLFAATIYDSTHSPTSLSLARFQESCETVWPRFVWPYVGGEKAVGRGKNAQWNFQKLLIRQRSLLQNAAGETLVASLLPKARQAITFDELQQEQQSALSESSPSTSQPAAAAAAAATITAPTAAFLPFFPTLILMASYLASHTPSKLDILLFSRLSSSSRSARTKRNYHKRKLLQPTSKPKHNNNNNNNNNKSSRNAIQDTDVNKASTTPNPKPSHHNKNNRNKEPSSHTPPFIPRPFPLDRLVAILRTIHPCGIPNRRSQVDGVTRRLVRLEGLNLVVRVDDGGTGATGEERRWRVNVSRAFVDDVAARIGGGAGGVGGEGEGGMMMTMMVGLIREFELVD